MIIIYVCIYIYIYVYIHTYIHIYTCVTAMKTFTGPFKQTHEIERHAIVMRQLDVYDTGVAVGTLLNKCDNDDNQQRVYFTK